MVGFPTFQPTESYTISRGSENRQLARCLGGSPFSRLDFPTCVIGVSFGFPLIAPNKGHYQQKDTPASSYHRQPKGKWITSSLAGTSTWLQAGAWTRLSFGVDWLSLGCWSKKFSAAFRDLKPFRGVAKGLYFSRRSHPVP